MDNIPATQTNWRPSLDLGVAGGESPMRHVGHNASPSQKTSIRILNFIDELAKRLDEILEHLNATTDQIHGKEIQDDVSNKTEPKPEPNGFISKVEDKLQGLNMICGRIEADLDILNNHF